MPTTKPVRWVWNGEAGHARIPTDWIPLIAEHKQAFGTTSQDVAGYLVCNKRLRQAIESRWSLLQIRALQPHRFPGLDSLRDQQHRDMSEAEMAKSVIESTNPATALENFTQRRLLDFQEPIRKLVTEAEQRLLATTPCDQAMYNRVDMLIQNEGPPMRDLCAHDHTFCTLGPVDASRMQRVAVAAWIVGAV